MTQEQILREAVRALDSKKAEDIQVVGIRDLTIIADYFVIANGTSTTHTKALADEVEYKIGLLGKKPARVEGYASSNWIILDYSDVVIHVFYKETRQFYSLERLWSDGEHVDISKYLK
ncbi:MAG: ribosome-associated protein [Clostridiales bacterium]|jgi:ribosome-associated protein|nr:iojap-related protein [Oscillospiraceae bacterium]MDN5378563.1 ribosome-associated protein [Clostridiales bacterium]